MSFYQPQFLWGLLALAIPILVHLFHFRRVRRVYFSNLQFLRQVKETKKQQLRLKHYLILASRLLAIFFLVMIFAQPYIPMDEEISQGEEVWVYLDNSPSMGTLTPEGIAAFDQGVAAVNALLDIYPQGTSFRLMTNAFATNSQVVRSQGEVRESLTEVAVGSRIRTLEEVTNRFAATRSDASIRKDVYYISDFQSSVFAQESPVEVDSTWQLFMVPIGLAVQNNVLVDSAYLETPYLQRNEANALRVALRNVGDANEEDLLVKLFVNDVQVGNASLNLSAQASGEVTFPINFPLRNLNRCRISIEEYPVVFDNDFYFTLRLAGRVRIVEIKPNSGTTVVQKVYGNPNLFDFTSFTTDNVDYSALENADMVVLTELNTWDAALQGAITRYQQGGGTLALIPGSEPNLETYQSVVNAQLTKTMDPVLQNLDDADTDNPFFQRIFSETSERVSMPKAMPFMQWNSRTIPLLKFRSGLPFLTRFEQGNATYLFASPFQKDYGAFAQHALFVPVMYRMAVLSKRAEDPLFYRLNRTTFTFPSDSLSPESLYTLVRSGEEIIPGQHVGANQVVMEVPQNLLSPGYYGVVSPNADTLTTLAFNLDVRESRMEPLETEALPGLFSGTTVRVVELSGSDDFQQEMRALQEGNSLWRYALWLTLLFLLVEIALVRWL